MGPKVESALRFLDARRPPRRSSPRSNGCGTRWPARRAPTSAAALTRSAPREDHRPRRARPLLVRPGPDARWSASTSSVTSSSRAASASRSATTSRACARDRADPDGCWPPPATGPDRDPHPRGAPPRPHRPVPRQARPRQPRRCGSATRGRWAGSSCAAAGPRDRPGAAPAPGEVSRQAGQGLVLRDGPGDDPPGARHHAPGPHRCHHRGVRPVHRPRGQRPRLRLPGPRRLHRLLLPGVPQVGAAMFSAQGAIVGWVPTSAALLAADQHSRPAEGPS